MVDRDTRNLSEAAAEVVRRQQRDSQADPHEVYESGVSPKPMPDLSGASSAGPPPLPHEARTTISNDTRHGRLPSLVADTPSAPRSEAHARPAMDSDHAGAVELLDELPPLPHEMHPGSGPQGRADRTPMGHAPMTTAATLPDARAAAAAAQAALASAQTMSLSAQAREARQGLPPSMPRLPITPPPLPTANAGSMPSSVAPAVVAPHPMVAPVRRSSSDGRSPSSGRMASTAGGNAAMYPGSAGAPVPGSGPAAQVPEAHSHNKAAYSAGPVTLHQAVPMGQPMPRVVVRDAVAPTLILPRMKRRKPRSTRAVRLFGFLAAAIVGGVMIGVVLAKSARVERNTLQMSSLKSSAAGARFVGALLAAGQANGAPAVAASGGVVEILPLGAPGVNPADQVAAAPAPAVSGAVAAAPVVVAGVGAEAKAAAPTPVDPPASEPAVAAALAGAGATDATGTSVAAAAAAAAVESRGATKPIAESGRRTAGSSRPSGGAATPLPKSAARPAATQAPGSKQPPPSTTNNDIPASQPFNHLTF